MPPTKQFTPFFLFFGHSKQKEGLFFSSDRECRYFHTSFAGTHILSEFDPLSHTSGSDILHAICDEIFPAFLKPYQKLLAQFLESTYHPSCSELLGFILTHNFPDLRLGWQKPCFPAFLPINPLFCNETSISTSSENATSFLREQMEIISHLSQKTKADPYPHYCINIQESTSLRETQLLTV